MGKLLEKSVNYHGCGSCYMDGTRKIVPKNRKCIQLTFEAFWKNTIDVNNKVEMRNRLKHKTKATFDNVKRYYKVVNNNSEKFRSSYFSSDENSTSDDESLNIKSLIENVNTDQYLSTSEDETGKNLVIDETKSRDKNF